MATILLGDTKPEDGLVVRVDRVERGQAHTDETVKEIRDAARKLFWTVMAAILTSIGLIVANAVGVHWH